MPPEDQGYVFGSIILPDGATLARTGEVGAKLQKMVAENPAVDHMFVVTGFDLIGGGNKTNAATMFIPLKPWDKRKETRRGRDASTCHAKGGTLTEGIVLAFNPPPIRGLGTAGGFEVFLQDRVRRRPEEAERGAAAVHRRAAQAPGADRHQHVLPARPCRSSWSRSTARRRSRSACR